MLHESGLQPSMLCEVASMVIYLSDFILAMRNPNITPCVSWHNMKPAISHLRPFDAFGCTAYAKILVEADSTHDLPSVLINGYFSRDAYRLYDP